MSHYNVVVAVEGTDGRTRYTRVGVMFENRRKDTGEPWYKIQMDIPVATQELLAFPPRPDEAATGEAQAGRAPEADPATGEAA